MNEPTPQERLRYAVVALNEADTEERSNVAWATREEAMMAATAAVEQVCATHGEWPKTLELVRKLREMLVREGVSL